MSCQICGAGLPAGAMFCGECGSSTRATATTRRRPDPRPSDTTIIQPLPPAPSVVSVAIPVPPTIDVPAPVPAAVSTPAPASAGLSTPAAGSETRRSRSGRHAKPAEPSPESAAPVPAADIPAAVPAADIPAADVPAADVPAPAAPPARTAASPFVLQFSTGETVAVHGTGLVGRRPLPQPAEHFDHLIQIADVGMSVSKSHLEFGQHDGELWISDRYSGNGTIVRRPGEGALRCEPGRRYLVPRGSRVEIADQFFVVN